MARRNPLSPQTSQIALAFSLEKYPSSMLLFTFHPAVILTLDGTSTKCNPKLYIHQIVCGKICLTGNQIPDSSERKELVGCRVRFTP